MIVSDVALEKPQTAPPATSTNLTTNGESVNVTFSRLGVGNNSVPIDLKAASVYLRVEDMNLPEQDTHVQIWSSRMTGCSKLGQEPPMAWSGTKSCRSPALYSTQLSPDRDS